MKAPNTVNRVCNRPGDGLRGMVAWLKAILICILVLLTLPSFARMAQADSRDSGRKQESGAQRQEVVFITGDVRDITVLRAGLQPGQELHVLDAKRNGVAQMAQTLAGRRGVDAIHLVSHGSRGAVHLGAVDLNGQSMTEQAGDLHVIGQALKPGGDILLYGCNVAQGAQGARFVDQLASATGHVIAASTDTTGTSALGGNWTLEYVTGKLHATPLNGAGYRHTLAPTTATFQFDFGLPTTPQNTVTETAFTNNGTNETMQLVSVGDGLASLNTWVGAPALAGSDSLVSAGWTGMSSLTLSLQSGHKFDLTSFMEQEGSGISGLLSLTSNKGSITFFVDGSGSINTRNVAAHPGAAYLQGITSVTLTYSGSPWSMVFDNIVLNNINPVPTVSSMSPTSGPVAGGTSVTITGANFSGTTAVTIGGAAATGVTVNSDTSITATTPAGTAGARDVVVTTAAGSGTGAGLFTYRLPPTATTGSASSINASGATLNGTVNDNGVTTTMSFDYGATTGYGANASAGTLGAGTGSTPTAVSVSGLSCNTTYHFRVKGVSSAGTTNGSDATFTTSACVPDAPTSPVATAGNAQATITFSAPGSNGGSAITGYTATSNPGGLSGTCAGPAACPITVTGLGNGTAYTFTVTATNAVGTGSASVASNIVTTQAPQSITFNNPGTQNFGSTPTLSATATSGLTVTFTSITTSVCAITSGGVLSFVATGTCTINADQAGNSAYVAAAPVQQSFTVNTAVPSAPTIGTATANDAQATVSFNAPASNGGAVITGYTATCVSGDGGTTGSNVGGASPITVSGLTNGRTYTCSVTASNGVGTGGASAASNPVTPRSNQAITFAAPGAQNFGTTPTLTANSTSGLAVTFSSTTTSVCTITGGGTLSFLTTGACTINADQAGNGSYAAAVQVQQSFSVNAVAPGSATIGTATASDAQATVSFSAPASNGGAVITGYTATCVSGDGGTTGSSVGGASPITVSGLTNGKTYTCSVTASNGVGAGGASAASNVVTPKGAQTITFANPGAQTFGTTPTLSASASSGLMPTFTSSTTGVCTITSGGALTFVTAGICTINADQASNGTYAAAPQVSQTFTVNAVVPGAPTIGTATASDAQATVSFSAPASNGGAVITGYTATCVSGDGGTTGSNVGGASPITVSGLTNGKTYTCSVNGANSAGSGSASAASNAITPKTVQTITFTNPGAQNFGTTPTLTATASSSLPVSFTSSNTGVCTVTSGGVLTLLTTGTCTINADQAGNGSYLAASQVSRSFTVSAVVPGAPTIGTATAGDTQASVTFTAPAFNGGATISGYTVTSNASGVTGTGAASPITVTGLTNGISYTFTVTATNSAGTGAASAASNTVTPAPGPAVVSLAVPANGSYRTGQNLDFTITWDQSTTVTGTPRIALVIGATTVQANYVSSPTSTTTLFRYTVLAGQTDTDGITVGALTLNGGTIRNAANTDATLTLNSVGSTAGVLVDTTAPTLPVANIVVNNQADPHKVILTFSEALASGSLGSAAGWTVTANGGSPTYSVASVALTGGNQVILTLSAVDMANAATTITNVAANAHLKVTPPATLTDVAGNTYAAGLVTEAGATHVLDATPPTLSAVVTSAPTTTGGSLAATSSEKAMGYWIAVASGSAAPTVSQTQAGVAYGAVTVVAHGSGALPNATPGSLSLTGLSASTNYDIYLVAQDAAGNLSAAVSTATLTTAAVVVPDPVTDPFTQLPTPAPIPGIGGLPAVINMGSGSGPAISNCLMDTLRQTLGGDAVYLGQTASGEVRVGWNGQIISFYPLAANTTDARSTGLHNQGTNPLDVVTSCGTLNVTPALFNPTGLGAFLAGMGATAQINQQGVITVLFNGSYYVVRPDFVVTTGTSGGPSLGFGADGLLRFTDANGNTQILRPAVLDPGALQTQVGLMGGSMVVQLDGTVLMVLGNGQQFVLTPDLTLGAIPAPFASLSSWQDGPLHYGYRIMSAPFTLYSQGVGVSIKP